MTIRVKRKPSDWRRALGISAAAGEPRGLGSRGGLGSSQIRDSEREVLNGIRL